MAPVRLSLYNFIKNSALDAHKEIHHQVDQVDDWIR